MHAGECRDCARELQTYVMLEHVFPMSVEEPIAAALPEIQHLSSRSANHRLAWAASCCVAMLAIGIWAALPQLRHLSDSPRFANSMRPSPQGSFHPGQMSTANSNALANNAGNGPLKPAPNANQRNHFQDNNSAFALLAAGKPSVSGPEIEATENSVIGDGLELQSSWLRAGNPAPQAPRRTLASLRQCYEITAELPGIRPLESSLQWAIDTLQRVFSPTEVPRRSPEQPNSSWRPLQNNRDIA